MYLRIWYKLRLLFCRLSVIYQSITFQKVEDTEENTWDVLHDNFMMGSKMKDWDRISDNNSASECVSDIDSCSDT